MTAYERQLQVYLAVKEHEPVGSAEISELTGLSASQVGSALLCLRNKGHVELHSSSGSWKYKYCIRSALAEATGDK